MYIVNLLKLPVYLNVRICITFCKVIFDVYIILFYFNANNSFINGLITKYLKN